LLDKKGFLILRDVRKEKTSISKSDAILKMMAAEKGVIIK
jgi:hypothetical protein